MASALSKEMEMMELQLNRFKELAHEALSLHGEAHSLKSVTRYKGFVCEPFPSFFFSLLLKRSMPLFPLIYI